MKKIYTLCELLTLEGSPFDTESLGFFTVKKKADKAMKEVSELYPDRKFAVHEIITDTYIMPS